MAEEIVTPEILTGSGSWPPDAGHAVVVARVVYGSADGPDTGESPDAEAIAGTLVITADREVITYRGNPPTTFVMKKDGIRCKLKGDRFESPAGKNYLVLPPTSGGGIAEQGWTYTARWYDKAEELLHEVTFAAPHGEIIDLTLVATTEPSAGEGAGVLATVASAVYSVQVATQKAAEAAASAEAAAASQADTQAKAAAAAADAAQMAESAKVIEAQSVQMAADSATVTAGAKAAAGDAAAAKASAQSAEASASEMAASASVIEAQSIQIGKDTAAAKTAAEQAKTDLGITQNLAASASTASLEAKAAAEAAAADLAVAKTENAEAKAAAVAAKESADRSEGYVEQVNTALASGMFDFEIDHVNAMIRLKAKGSTEWSDWVALPKGDTGRGIQAATIMEDGHLWIAYDDQPDAPVDAGVARVEYTMRVDQTDGNLYYQDNLGNPEKNAGLARGIDGAVGPAPTLVKGEIIAGDAWGFELTATQPGTYRVDFTAPTPAGVSETVVNNLSDERLRKVRTLALAGL